MQKLLTTIKHPAAAKAHWKDHIGWQMAEAIETVNQEPSKCFMYAAQYSIAISLDEATNVDNMTVMCVHVFVLVDLERWRIL